MFQENRERAIPNTVIQASTVRQLNRHLNWRYSMFLVFPFVFSSFIWSLQFEFLFMEPYHILPLSVLGALHCSSNTNTWLLSFKCRWLLLMWFLRLLILVSEFDDDFELLYIANYYMISVNIWSNLVSFWSIHCWAVFCLIGVHTFSCFSRDWLLVVGFRDFLLSASSSSYSVSAHICCQLVK